MNAIRSFAAAALLVSAPALAGHTIWSNRSLGIMDNGVSYPASNVSMTIAWNETTFAAYASFHATANGSTYDFDLVGSSVTAVTASNINGLWNIQRDGVLICAGCTGSVYGLTAPVNSGIKFYDSTSKFHFGAFVDARQDY